MRRINLLLVVLLTSIGSVLFAQDTLPKFSVVNPGNDNIIISWANNYEDVGQISVQTSHDSLKNYRTIVSVTDPNSKLNGVVDKTPINDHMYYRLFVVMGNGDYFFTEAKQPTRDAFTNLTHIPGVNLNLKRPDFVPSFYVYTNSDGFVYINLLMRTTKNTAFVFSKKTTTYFLN